MMRREKNFVNMSEILWRIILELTNTPGMLFVGLVYAFWEWRTHKKSKPVVLFVCLICFAMISSQMLKQIFKVPLIFDPTRYGFPSGHTQTATAFYGWIISRTNIRLIHKISIFSIIMFLIGCSMIHFGFHTWFDIFGGLTFGLVCLLIFKRQLKN